MTGDSKPAERECGGSGGITAEGFEIVMREQVSSAACVAGTRASVARLPVWVAGASANVARLPDAPWYRCSKYDGLPSHQGLSTLQAESLR